MCHRSVLAFVTAVVFGVVGGGCHEEQSSSISATRRPLTKGSGGVSGVDTDYCNDPAFPCAAGEGDCDSDSQCAGALVCGVDNGVLYGMPEMYDACWGAHCDNLTQDGDETGVDCGGSCPPCSSCPGTLGDPTYCSAECRCNAGEGDCDTDADCQPGLVCGTNNGPRFGFHSDIDACWLASCQDGQQNGNETGVDCGGPDCGPCPSCGGTNGDPTFCSAECPCAATEGDCDGDHECQPGLVCGVDNGVLFGHAVDIDACWLATCQDGQQNANETGVDCGGPDCGPCMTCSGTVGSGSYCSGCLCGVGEGDCDGDHECQAGLVCGVDNGPIFGFLYDIDVCWAAHCEDGQLSGDEWGVDCGPSCGPCPSCTSSLGDPSFCTPECRCASGEGDCDTDADCQSGLVCGVDNGERFGFSADTDACWPATCQDGQQNGDEWGIDCGGACGPCLAEPCPVTREHVDNGWEVGYYTSLALDSSGRPRISYLAGGSGNLKFAAWDGSTWQIQTVVSVGDVGYYTSLALDSSDRPHIGYWNQTSSNLEYTWWDGSAWQFETVDSVGDVGRGLSLELDSSDRPHISYLDGTNGNLKYARWNGSSWQIETVDSSGEIEERSSLALDSANRPRICYYNDVHGMLMYAAWDGSQWQIETVDDAGVVGQYCSLALDAGDAPHISYLDGVPAYDLKYAYWDGASWQIRTVDAHASEWIGHHTSLALDGSGYPHISYSNLSTNVLKYAHWDGNDFQIQDVDLGGGEYTSLALDAAGDVHISYLDPAVNQLQRAVVSCP